MVRSLLPKWKKRISVAPLLRRRSFRSKAALECLARASEEKVPNIVLYNYPSFSGAFSALFARLFHCHLNLPCLILPFSSVEPLRVEDFYVEGLEKCYFLDFLGPKGFALELSRTSPCQIIGFDHRKTALSKVPPADCSAENIAFHVDLKKSSSRAVYEYFSTRLEDFRSPNEGEVVSLVKPEDQYRVEMVLKYIAGIDLRQWSLPDIREFNIGISEWRSKLNCITNPYIYEQGIRADGCSNLSDEIGKKLSEKSAAAGFRPIGAVIYMQRKNLKMCLRSTDSATDTSEVAKAYGGGGSPSSSSFMIRMDEYNMWRSS